MIRIKLTVKPACLLEVNILKIYSHTHSASYSRELLNSVSIDFAVAMIAAAQRDVVIDIEERPIMKTEVNKNVHTKGGRRYFLIYFFLLISILFSLLFVSHFVASRRKGEILAFHR